MINPTHIVTHKDGRKELVRLIGDDPNYWMGDVEKFVRKNHFELIVYPKRIFGGLMVTTPEVICRMTSEFLYKTLSPSEKMLYVEKTVNVPFSSNNCFYVRAKYLKRLTFFEKLFMRVENIFKK